MSVFGDNPREQIYEELRYIYEEEYKDHQDDIECKFNFVMDILYVLRSWLGDW